MMPTTTIWLRDTAIEQIKQAEDDFSAVAKKAGNYWNFNRPKKRDPARKAWDEGWKALEVQVALARKVRDDLYKAAADTISEVTPEMLIVASTYVIAHQKCAAAAADKARIAYVNSQVSKS